MTRKICKTLLMGLVVAMAALSQSGNIAIPLPPDPNSPYVVPSSDATSQNPDYWNGYAQGETQAQVVLPSPANLCWYSANGFVGYKVFIGQAYKPAVTGNFVNNVDVGYNSALNDGGYYLWSHDQTSCHFKVCACGQ